MLPENAPHQIPTAFRTAPSLAPLERLDLAANQAFVLITPPADVPMKMPGPIGEIALQEAIYKPLVEIMAENGHAPKSVNQLLAHPTWKGQSLPVLWQSLLVLTAGGHLYPVQDAEAIKAAQPRCKKLNAYICQRARDGGEITFLASPVIGGGIPVSRFLQLFLLARHSGKNQPSEWAAATWELLSSQGQRSEGRQDVGDAGGERRRTDRASESLRGKPTDDLESSRHRLMIVR